jgi:NitT/TauT family transport system substrate-binding protein
MCRPFALPTGQDFTIGRMGRMLRPNRLFCTFIAAVLAATLAGAGASAQSPATVAVRIGTPGQEGNAGVYYAQDGGYFKRAGLDADILTMRAGSGGGVVAAVAGGSLDIGEADLISLVAAHQRGIKVSLLAPSATWSATQPTAGMIVAKSAPIHSGKDLEGKTIGVPSLGGLSRLATTVWLEKTGGELSKVKFVEIPSAEMSAAVGRGTIDAAVITEPTLSAAVAEGHPIVATMYDAIGNGFIETAWFASDDWIAKHPDLALKFARAMRDAQRWANGNRVEAATIYRKYSQAANDTRVKATYGETLDPARMQPLLDAALKYRVIVQPIAARELISPAVGAL